MTLYHIQTFKFRPFVGPEKSHANIILVGNICQKPVLTSASSIIGSGKLSKLIYFTSLNYNKCQQFKMTRKFRSPAGNR